MKTTEKEKIQENMTYAADEKTPESAEDKTPVESAGKRTKAWLVKVRNNPGFCGIGAGGVQFANGQAMIESERMASWFREHNGYSVTEQ